jgi:hypothetical protein
MTSRHALVLVLALGGGSAALAATEAGGQPAHDPCALVTPAQVSSALGANADPGQPIGKTGCQWSSDPKAKTGHVMVTLSIWPENKYFSNKSTPGIPTRPATGIGDEAYFATLGDLTSLHVKKGKSTLDVRVYGLHDPARQEEIERSVAKEALARW